MIHCHFHLHFRHCTWRRGEYYCHFYYFSLRPLAHSLWSILSSLITTSTVIKSFNVCLLEIRFNLFNRLKLFPFALMNVPLSLAPSATTSNCLFTSTRKVANFICTHDWLVLLHFFKQKVICSPNIRYFNHLVDTCSQLSAKYIATHSRA